VNSRMSICPRNIVAGIAANIAALFLTIPAMAMSAMPLVLDLTTAGSKNHGQISVVNDASKPLPVEIVISRIELDEKGDMTPKPAGDEFLIFPAQALVAPGATQNFGVQWVGDPQIPAAQSYVFSVNQVPVKMPDGKSGVQVVFNFSTIVNIDPVTGTADINLVKAGIGIDETGKRRPELTVKNPGNLHAKLTDATIKLSGSSWSKTLTTEQLRQILGVGLIQPGKTRRFILPIDLPDGVSQVTASIEYKPSK
jgi:fimbrial chaperone protein